MRLDSESLNVMFNVEKCERDRSPKNQRTPMQTNEIEVCVYKNFERIFIVFYSQIILIYKKSRF